jgi:hypothetical protein
VPTQEYLCDSDGPFHVCLKWEEDVLSEMPCPECGASSRHVLCPPAGVKFSRTWNEQANEWQRDPYTQAKAQAWNVYNEQRDAGIRLDKPTEEGYQRGAAAIDHESRHPRPDAHTQQMAHYRRARKKKDKQPIR